MADRLHAAKCRVESFLPGRVRLRVPRPRRRDAIPRITRSLRGLDGVLAIAASVVTGGILLEFDPELLDLEELNNALGNADVAVELGTQLGKLASEPAVEKMESKAPGLRDLMQRLTESTPDKQAIRGLANGVRALAVAAAAGVLVSRLLARD